MTRGSNGDTAPRTWRRWSLIMAAVSTMTLVLAGCGNGGATESQTSTSSAGVTVDRAAAKTIAAKAFGMDVNLDELPAEAVEAFSVAAQPLTKDQVQKAIKCFEAPTCELGNGPIHVGIFNGVDNMWRKVANMEIILQALQHPEIGKITYAIVPDLAGAQSAIRNMTAQGVNAILGYNDWGMAMAPAFTQAQRDGAVVSTFTGFTKDMPTTAVKNQVHADNCKAGASMANVVVEDPEIGAKSVAIFNGVAGSPQGEEWNGCLKDKFSAGNGPSIGFTQDTGWTTAGTFKAASALIASGKHVQAILTDYADPVPAIVGAFDQAGASMPAVVTWTSNNDLFRIWEKDQGTDKKFPLYYTNALTSQARISLTNLVNLINGKTVPAETVVPMPLVKAKPGVYSANRPGDYPGATALIPDDVMDAMLK
jgi:ABC-type sugar transport system substrate-binding protein